MNQPRLGNHVSPAMFAKVLARNANRSLVETPEGKLVIAMLQHALRDADVKGPYQNEAREFFIGQRMNAMASLIELNPDFVRESLGRIREWAKH